MARLDKVPTTARRRTINNKTRLKVLSGDVSGELVTIDEDDNKHKSLDIDTAGVEHEDAKEEHLVQVLAASARRLGGGPPSQSGPEAPAVYIPIPDATKIFDQWSEFYPTGQWVDPSAFVQSSVTLEQHIDGFLLSGVSYDMDEKDDRWLQAHNASAKGEGTSTSPKTKKAKENESASFVISENEFELTMGLFETFTDEKFPYLHLDITQFPPLAEFEPSFATASSNTFLWASFEIPPHCKDASVLLRLSHAIYPWWKQRKVQRKGKKIIPQLNLDESNDTDPFVCFRRRDGKTVRKTRRTDTTPADKITRLRMELQNVSDLASSVVMRETEKIKVGKGALEVFEARLRLYDLKRKFPTVVAAQDDQLLIEQERPPAKRQRVSEVSGTIKLSRRPRETVEAAQAPLVPEPVDVINPRQLAASVEADIEHAYAQKRQPGWEDYLDLPTSRPSGVAAAALFRTIQDVAKARESRKSTDEPVAREGRSMRVRMGRGGRCHVDRRPVGRRAGPPTAVPGAASNLNRSYMERFAKSITVWDANEPVGPSSPMETSPTSTAQSQVEQEEVLRRTDERWRFDNDDLAADDEDRTLVDDFEIRYLTLRATTFTGSELQRLNIDTTHLKSIDNAILKAHGEAMQPLHKARTDFNTQLMENRKKQLEARAAAAAAVSTAGTEKPSTPAPTAQAPSTTSQTSPVPPTSTAAPATNPAAATSNLSQTSQAASSLPQSTPIPTISATPITGAAQTNGIHPTPTPTLTPQMQQILLAKQRAQQQLQQPLRPGSQPNGVTGVHGVVSRPPLTPQQQQLLAQHQAQLLASATNGSPGMSAADVAMRQAQAQQAQAQAAAAAARSSPVTNQSQTTDHNGVNGQISPARPAQPQPGGQPLNPFPQVPLSVYQAHLAQQAAQANGVNGQVNGAQLYGTANATPQQQRLLQQHAMAVQAQLAQAQLKNGQAQPNLMPPPTQAQTGAWAAPAMPTPTVANAALQSVGLSTTTNMALKMPPGRQMAWRQSGDALAATQQALLAAQTGSPVPQNLPSPTVAATAGRASPVRPLNGAQGGRASPLMSGVHPGSSPVADQHLTPQTPRRQTPTPSPLGHSLPQQDLTMLHQSPHLALRSPARPQQIIGSSPS
ncbi:hypothetical protein DL93DRAFT_2163453 [Clavulina sp. PMI_390]|nr:hypothetical protein DL93DRAFT_2163453 [Clavulina sp. PMI_390]